MEVGVITESPHYQHLQYKTSDTDINNKAAGREIHKTIPFKIAPKARYLRINLAKEVKGLYPENYKILMKGIEDTNK